MAYISNSGNNYYPPSSSCVLEISVILINTLVFQIFRPASYRPPDEPLGSICLMCWATELYPPPSQLLSSLHCNRASEWASAPSLIQTSVWPSYLAARRSVTPYHRPLQNHHWPYQRLPTSYCRSYSNRPEPEIATGPVANRAIGPAAERAIGLAAERAVRPAAEIVVGQPAERTIRPATERAT